MNETKKMRPIWYFVGWVLLLCGILVVMAGVYGLFAPVPNESVVGYLHPDLWWGAIMIFVGLIYILTNRKVRIE
ncbi:hypothetical protein DRQ09_07740 [candidate division KSB1 bacterium]|nr:MAG: hypothetical protein DRQ09_07740 [candidate division KSB1 bacterium]